MRMKLTDKAIQKLKAPATGRLDVFDTEATGLHLRLSASGARTWRYVYRINGTQRVLSWDGLVPLGEVRHLAREAAVKAARGIDPAEARDAAKAPKPAALTVDALVEQWAAVYPTARKLSPVTFAEYRRILRREVLPTLGEREAPSITKADCKAVVDAVMARGCGSMANRTTEVLKILFGWATDADRLPASPAATLKAPAKEVSRDRVLSDAEITAAWATLSTYGKVQLLTAARGGELAMLPWSAVDVENKTITFEAATTKTNVTRLVPLSAPALALLRDLRTRAEGSAVFASLRDPNAAISYARHGVKQALGVAGVMGATPHDLRRTAATGLARVGTDRVVIKLILGHSERADVTARYDRWARFEERRVALEKWGALVMQIVGEAVAAPNVIPLEPRSAKRA